jgi:predicted SAM-dependent methyltransferase
MENMEMENLKLAIGCGTNKKPSFIGIDKLDVPGVDYIVDFENEKLPFPDNSVSEIYSYHCLEHLRNPSHVFSEFGRVCKDGAKIEIWTPYAFSNAAFMPDHKFFFAEDIYYHICCWYQDFWYKIINSYWHVKEFIYTCSEDTLKMLAIHKIPVGFAIKYLKNICKDFVVYIEVWNEDKSDVDSIPRYVTVDNVDEKIDISEWWRPVNENIDYFDFHRKTSKFSTGKMAINLFNLT